MSWEAWILVAWQVLNAVVGVAIVGKPFQFERTGPGAVFFLFLYAGLTWLVLRVAGVL